jgi:hypothetical protein
MVTSAHHPEVLVLSKATCFCFLIEAAASGGHATPHGLPAFEQNHHTYLF